MQRQFVVVVITPQEAGRRKRQMSEARQAVILAGGKGTRLTERLGTLPKPLVDVAGVPLLERQLRALHAAEVTDVLVLANHRIDQIRAFLRDRAVSDLSIAVIDDGEPRGTAGALLHAFDALQERFLVIYGDTLFDVDLNRFWQAHIEAGAQASLFLHPSDHPFDSDLVELDDQQRIISFHAPPHADGAWLPNRVNAALYVVERASLGFWRDHPFPSDMARDLFPAMIKRGMTLHGYVSFEYIKDVGTPQRLDKAVAHLRRGVIERARRDRPQALVFLDRDGTINELHGHIGRAADLSLIEGAAQAIRRLNDAEYRVVVATNQPVLARGETSFAELRRIHAKLETELGKVGAIVDAIEICPHHPDRGFAGEVAALKITCACRKPGTLMVDRACRALNADRSRSWLVGDSTGDILCAKRSNLRSVLIATGQGGRDGKHAVRPDYCVKDLSAAVDFIVSQHSRLLALVAPIAAELLEGDLVLIGGLARRGKSTMSSALREVLVARGFAAEIFSLDGSQIGASAGRCDASDGNDPDSAQSALANWLAGHCLVDPADDSWARPHSPGSVPSSLPATGILIVEGQAALCFRPTTQRRIMRLFVACGDLASGGVLEDCEAGPKRAPAGVQAILATQEIADIVLSLDCAFEL